MPIPDKDRPDYKCKAHKKVVPWIKIVRDVSSGTPALREAGITYLPEEPKERPDDYRVRKDRTVFFPAYRKTRESLVGAVCRKPIVTDKVTPSILPHLEDIDLAGNHIDVFVQNHFRDQFEGASLILVDYEKPLERSLTTLSSTPTGLDDLVTNRRPFWVSYKHDQVVNWRRERINGKQEFTLITFEEISTDPDGAYGEKEVKRYRTFRKANGVVTWQLWRLNSIVGKADAELELEDQGQLTISRIPVAVAGELGNPPCLLDMAYLNVLHWQNISDQENILHICRVPMLVRVGNNLPPEVVVKATCTLDVPEGGNAFWLEVKGEAGAIGAGRQNILDIEQRMGMIGLSTLTQRSDADITATEKKQDYREKYSELAGMAVSEKDCIEQALSFHAEYMGLGIDGGGSIELGASEEELTLTPEYLRVLLDAVGGTPSKLSLETFLTVLLNLLMQTGLVSDEIKVEDEVSRINEAQKTMEQLALPNVAQKALQGAPNMVKQLYGAQGNGQR